MEEGFGPGKVYAKGRSEPPRPSSVYMTYVPRPWRSRLRFLFIVHTISPAEITFDPAKDVTNTAKHGVSLALASELEWADLMAQADTRRDYGEDRMIGYTPIGERVFCVVFMDRDDQRRILYMDAPYIASTYGLSESGSDCINISGL